MCVWCGGGIGLVQHFSAPPLSIVGSGGFDVAERFDEGLVFPD